jgi:hypothetical protein
VVHFVDGPAAGKGLSLARTPLFLRVVIDHAGKVDALDQLDDEPQPTERIYVYRLCDMTSVIYCSRGHGCRRERVAEYRFHLDAQPTDEEARDREKWQAWAMNQAETVQGA